MKTGKLLNNLAGFGLAIFFFAGFGFLLAPEANAQYRRDDRGAWRAERAESRNITRIADAQGYSDGLREGANAVRGRKRYNPYGEGKYKKGTNGYKSRFGNKATYKRIYQRAFVRGYDEAYYRNPRGIRRIRRNW
jgi:hypothetical protein